jgi:hypothetical protein
MDHSFSDRGPRAGDDVSMETGLRKATKFFIENEKAISDYAGQAGLIFEMGKAWTFDMEKRRGTFDPIFFYDRGFSAAECMWATCREIEHLLDWCRDPEGYVELYRRIEKGRRLDLLYYYINDILATREVDRRFPAHRETRDYFYGSVLFPRLDYSSAPKHLQFITALLRERMMPGEVLNLGGKVRSAVNLIRNIDGQGTDLIDLVTDSTAKPRDRFNLIRDYIEPLYERFFQEDVQERKIQQKERADWSSEAGKGESAEGGSRGTDRGYIEDEVLKEGSKTSRKIEQNPPSDEDLFVIEYNEANDKLPHVFSPKGAREEIEKEINRQLEENRSAEQMAKEQFRSRHGVTAEEAEDYAEEYRKIEPHVLPLRMLFERIISTRKEVKRRLKERTDEGVIIDPSLIAQAYIDAQSGILSSRTQLKVMRQEFDENKPRDFEFTLICDLSGSMNENWPGGKSHEQKSSSILITEALDEFEKKLKEERLDKVVDLHVLTEVRGFHSEDEELKPLSDSIDFHTRVRISRRLDSCTGGRTADYKSLARVVASIDPETKKRIEDRDLKKVLILITDGGSDDVSLTAEAKKRLTGVGVIAKAIQIGKASNQDIKKFKHVWRRDGSPCKDVSQLVTTIEKLLEDFLRDL